MNQYLTFCRRLRQIEAEQSATATSATTRVVPAADLGLDCHILMTIHSGGAGSVMALPTKTATAEAWLAALADYGVDVS